MHSRGGLLEIASYDHADYGGDVVGGVLAELRESLAAATAAGVGAGRHRARPRARLLQDGGAERRALRPAPRAAGARPPAAGRAIAQAVPRRGHRSAGRGPGPGDGGGLRPRVGARSAPLPGACRGGGARSARARAARSTPRSHHDAARGRVRRTAPPSRSARVVLAVYRPDARADRDVLGRRRVHRRGADARAFRIRPARRSSC